MINLTVSKPSIKSSAGDHSSGSVPAFVLPELTLWPIFEPASPGLNCDSVFLS